MRSLLKRSSAPTRSTWPDFGPWNRFLNDQFLDLWDGDVIDTIPSMNVREEKDHFAVELAAPGLTKDDFQIDVEGNVLTISSQKETKTDEKDEAGKYSRREYNYSSFSRSFTLPESVDANKIDAKYKDGVLNLTIPKREEATKKDSRHHINVK